MGAYQTHLCKDNQENTVSNNARSVDDCSSRGMNLQRKSNAVLGGSNIMQCCAWVATKALDWLVKNDKCSWASEGDLCDTVNVKDGGVWYKNASIPRKGDEYVDTTKTRKKGGERERLTYNKSDTEHHHRHFIFSPMNPKKTPSPAEQTVHDEIKKLTKNYHSVASHGNPTNNNIGFESENGKAFNDNGALFSDDILHRGYTLREKISDNPKDDMRLIEAMKENVPKEGGTFGTYHLIGCNCQHWVEAVRSRAGL